jgi:hypothetical protein
VLYLFLIFISQKGFPIKISLDKLIAFFAKLDIGEVDTVFMRRNPNRDFKVSNGRIFLTFLRLLVKGPFHNEKYFKIMKDS